jgi:hypothetical protein
MSQLFEFKLEINPADQKKLVALLRLQHIKDYSDTDYFIKSKDPKLKEKIKELQEGTKHYKLFFDGAVFDIKGEEITLEKAQTLKEQGIVSEIHRTKSVYHWSEQGIDCAFDSIAQLEDRLFFEVYGRDRDTIIQAKNKLQQMGYKNVIEVGYDELVKI